VKLVVDECVDRRLTEALRAAGHDVQSVAELSPSVPDTDVLELATREGAVLVTEDNDFGELVFRQGRTHGGIVLIRLAGLESHVKAMIVCTAVTSHGAELPGRFTVISRHTVRIRSGLM
jgi:predicted nuclease of predicted toxin-antitoxin system